MLKKLANTVVRGINALKMRKNTQNIHTAFSSWIKNHPEYTNLVFTHGNRLLSRDHDGTYVIQAIRIAFECYCLDPRRGVTYIFWTRARKSALKNALVGAAFGLAFTVLLFKAYNVY